MKIPYDWLSEMFAAPLPPARELADLLTMRSFEIEGIQGAGAESVLEADVLPNRAHDCLGLRYVAREVSAVTGVPLKAEEEPKLPAGDAPSVSVSVEDARCRRYLLVEVSGLEVRESLEWLRLKVGSMDQRSINAVVDASNLVLFLENQPTHAFDADKVRGGIAVRGAVAGEKITTLDGRDIELDAGTLVIADDVGPLAIAGVKGGNRAGVTAETTRVYLESANFDPVTVRKAAQRYDLRTDSSKRFEVEISPVLAERGLARLVSVLRDVAAGEGFSVSGALDHYPRQAHPYKTGLSEREASALLGRPVTLAEATFALEAVGCEAREVQNPANRLFEVAQLAAEAVKPYKYAASVLYDAPEAFDCSSLVAYACSEAGFSAPRMAVDQYAWSVRVGESDLQPGDLVFSCIGGAEKRAPQTATMEYARGTTVPEPGIDHVGVYAGDGEVIHATGVGGNVVKREKISESPQFGKTETGALWYGRAEGAREPRLIVTVPPERLDLRAPEDLVEEIGRLGGLEAIPAAPLPKSDEGLVAGEFAVARAVRAALVSLGFYEIMTSSFAAEGAVEVQKPANREKPFLRTELAPSFAAVLERGLAYRDWLQADTVRAFEIGKVFTPKEELRVVVGVASAKRREAEEFSLPGGLAAKLEASAPAEVAYAEISLPAETAAESHPAFARPLLASHRFSALSPYPYAARDVAVWVPGEGGEETKVAEVIRGAAGELLAKLYKFDEFTKRKEGEPVRTSYAFRLILQSMDHTLSDEEITGATDAVYAALREQGWEIR